MGLVRSDRDAASLQNSMPILSVFMLFSCCTVGQTTLYKGTGGFSTFVYGFRETHKVERIFVQLDSPTLSAFCIDVSEASGLIAVWSASGLLTVSSLLSAYRTLVGHKSIWRERFDGLEADKIPWHPCGAMGVGGMSSTIELKMQGMGWFC